MYSIFYELTKSILVNIDTPRLSMMYLTLDHRGIGASLDLKASNAIIVNIILLKVALK